MVECSGLDSGGGSGGGGGGGGANIGSVMQTNSAQVTTPSAAFGDEENSCDSRWGKERQGEEEA